MRPGPVGHPAPLPSRSPAAKFLGLGAGGFREALPTGSCLGALTPGGVFSFEEEALSSPRSLPALPAAVGAHPADSGRGGGLPRPSCSLGGPLCTGLSGLSPAPAGAGGHAGTRVPLLLPRAVGAGACWPPGAQPVWPLPRSSQAPASPPGRPCGSDRRGGSELRGDASSPPESSPRESSPRTSLGFRSHCEAPGPGLASFPPKELFCGPVVETAAGRSGPRAAVPRVAASLGSAPAPCGGAPRLPLSAVGECGAPGFPVSMTLPRGPQPWSPGALCGVAGGGGIVCTTGSLTVTCGGSMAGCVRRAACAEGAVSAASGGMYPGAFSSRKLSWTAKRGSGTQSTLAVSISSSELHTVKVTSGPAPAPPPESPGRGPRLTSPAP